MNTQKSVLVVNVEWDPESKYWTATSDDVPGLVTEAPDFEGLVKRVIDVTPELLELNGALPQKSEMPLFFHSSFSAMVNFPARV